MKVSLESKFSVDLINMKRKYESFLSSPMSEDK